MLVGTRSDDGWPVKDHAGSLHVSQMILCYFLVSHAVLRWLCFYLDQMILRRLLGAHVI